ncbi:MAG: hypothetical protein GY922_01215 [Proteobacteria bacterium]|nr:hypothetical protein [Pseudomonadota bacterium]
MTVSSWCAKPALELLAYRGGIVNPVEIRDHKQYFNRDDLHALFAAPAGLELHEHSYSQWRFNNRAFAIRSA